MVRKSKNAKSSVMQPKFRMKVEKSKKDYKRKPKHKIEETDS